MRQCLVLKSARKLNVGECSYKQGRHESINDIDDICHDSIMIFSSENIMIFPDIFDIFKISAFIIIIYLLF